MKIREELLKEHSKGNTHKIAKWIGDDVSRFGELMHLFLSDELVLAQRASWVVSECAEMNPQLITPWLEQMIKHLDDPVHDAVRRNTVRILQNIHIPEDLIGLAATHCFNLLISPKEPVAVKAYCMTILLNITKREPGLKNELQIVILELMENGSPAIIARGKKTMAELERISGD